MKYKVEDLLVVYKDTPTFKDGAIVKVIERDPNDGSYSVASLESIFETKGDKIKLTCYHCKWVKEQDVYPITFNRRKGLISYLKGLFRCLIKEK